MVAYKPVIKLLLFISKFPESQILNENICEITLKKSLNPKHFFLFPNSEIKNNLVPAKSWWWLRRQIRVEIDCWMVKRGRVTANKRKMKLEYIYIYTSLNIEQKIKNDHLKPKKVVRISY